MTSVKTFSVGDVNHPPSGRATSDNTFFLLTHNNLCLTSLYLVPPILTQINSIDFRFLQKMLWNLARITV